MSNPGPSSDDRSFSHPLETIFSGFGSGGADTFGVGSDISTALPGSGVASPPTGVDVYTGTPPSGPSTSLSFGGTFGGGGAPGSGAAGASGASPFATITDPSGTGSYGGGSAFTSGTQPFQTYGASGEATGLGYSAGASGGPIAPGVPAGVTPQLSPDPTQTATAAPSAQATAAPTAASSGGGFSLENLVNGIGKSVTNNPLSFLGGLGSLYNAYQQHQAMKGIPSLSDVAPQLAQQASQLNEQGQALASYLTNGNLPPGLQSSLEQATKAAKAKVISNYAAQGMSTDPTQNTALAQTLAAIDQQAIISTAQIGQQLMQSGLNASQLSSNLYKTLAQIDQTQTEQIGKSIANFASAISGRGIGSSGQTFTLKAS